MNNIIDSVLGGNVTFHTAFLYLMFIILIIFFLAPEFKTVQLEVSKILRGKVLVGHSLKNDFEVGLFLNYYFFNLLVQLLTIILLTCNFVKYLITNLLLFNFVTI